MRVSEISADQTAAFIESQTWKALQDDILEFAAENAQAQRLLVETTFPLSVEQVLAATESFTNRLGKPTLVVPRAPVGVDGFKVNQYCTFSFKVSGEINDAIQRFELFKTYFAYDYNSSEDDRKLFRVVFVTQKSPMKWNYDPLLSFVFPRYLYFCRSSTNEEFTLLSPVKLKTGYEYTASGLLFDTPKLGDVKVGSSSRQTVMLTQHVSELVPEPLDARLLEKMRGKPFEWFAQSIMFPYHHCVNDYATLMALSAFHVSTGFPFNIMVIGQPNTGKTAVLKKLASFTKDEILEAGGSTLKGLLPTFSSSFQSGGLLAGARYRAMVNEFFEILSSVPKEERLMFLSRLKGTLEGTPVLFQSGNGRMTIQMTADFVACTNPPKRAGRGYHQSVLELYDHFEPAFLDRILFYWMPEDQLALVKENETNVKLLEASVKGNLCALDYETPGLLTPTELHRIIAWLKRIPYEFEDAQSVYAHAKELQENVPTSVFSKAIPFLINAASAFAVIRTFGEGLLASNSLATIVINGADLERAKNFLIQCVRSYSREDEKIGVRYRLIKALTPAEVVVFSKLAAAWESTEEKHAKRVPVELLRGSLTREEFVRIRDKLVGKGLAVFSRSHGMFVPELSDEALKELESIQEGHQPAPGREILAKYLVKQGLVGWSEERGFFDEWAPDSGQQGLGVLAARAEAQEARVVSFRDTVGDLKAYLKQGRYSDPLSWKTREQIAQFFSEATLLEALKVGEVEEPVSGRFRTRFNYDLVTDAQ